MRETCDFVAAVKVGPTRYGTPCIYYYKQPTIYFCITVYT